MKTPNGKRLTARGILSKEKIENWVTLEASLISVLCSFPVAAVVNHDKFRGLQQYGCILFCFWRSEVPFHWAPVEMSARPVLSGGAEGRTRFFACGHFLCFQRASFQLPLLSSHCHLLWSWPLLRPSYQERCDYRGPIWVIPENFPISRFLTLSHLYNHEAILTGSRDVDGEIFKRPLFRLPHVSTFFKVNFCYLWAVYQIN